MANTSPYTNLDFALVRQDLKSFLQGQTQFQDYDFEGSNMAVMLDILAYNTFRENLYKNLVFSELFLDSVQIRENAVSHAKELNYLPRSRQSSLSTLDLTLNVPNPSEAPKTIAIPKGTKFSAQCGTSTFTFITDRNRSVSNVNNVYQIDDLRVYEGREVREFYTVDLSNPVKYIINNENVDISSLKVYIRENSNPNSARVEWLRSADIFGVEASDKIFYLVPHFNNTYKIDFGKDVFGAEPAQGNVIELEYRVTRGEDANGAKNIVAISNIGGYTVTVNSSTVSTNGAERENIESIKFFAPRSIQVQERAVTVRDYEILLRRRFPNIRAISVYGGDTVDPPQFGKVIISVDVVGTEGASDAEIQEYRNYLSDKTALTIEPIFEPAKFLYVSIEANVDYNTRLTTVSSDGLAEVVSNTMLAFSESNLKNFRVTLRQSRLTNAIDESQNSFISTDIVAKPIIDYVPTIGIAENPIFDFNDELVQPYPFNELISTDTYVPAFTSTTFTLEGTLVSLQDDGQGNVIAISVSETNPKIFKRNLGTVDYTTGIVRLSNIVVETFETNAIKIKANTRNKDITSAKDRILKLRAEDFNITMRPVR